MRKEIFGILFFLLLIFTLVSLVSYSPHDPSPHHVVSLGHPVHNLFGVVGAYLAGLLIGLFGLGAFWIPVLLLLVSIHMLSGRTSRDIGVTVAGGLVLMIATGALLALKGNHLSLFSSRYSTGGIVGIPLKIFLLKYSNFAGALIVLLVLWVIGLIMTTRLSLIDISKKFWQLSLEMKAKSVKLAERRKKVKKQSAARKKAARKPKQKVRIQAPKPPPVKKPPVPKQQVFDFMKSGEGFQLPPVNFLDDPPPANSHANEENLQVQSQLLEKKLNDFGVGGRVSTVMPGPVITTFEYKPAAGVKISKIVNLADDLSLALRAMSIRIVGPIPGKAAIGIEVANSTRDMVHFKDIVTSSAFGKSKSPLTICMGKDIVGAPVVTQLDKMPHLLIAGATGTGKSVGLNSMICSLLYKSNPDEVKLILIDPKRIELTPYNHIPHLITPVVTSAKKATNALFWAVNEMENRYKLLSEQNVRNIIQYNNKIEKLEPKDGDPVKKLPYVVIIIDELADLMMVASRDVEASLMRLAQMARAAGIHLILATQRPSVDVLTGIIKANFPTRLSFQVSSRTDSRTIIDANGAESLLGNGDMLFLPPGVARLQRVHGAYISEPEIARITQFLKEQKKPEYDQKVTEAQLKETDNQTPEEEQDERYDDAVALVTQTRQASISKVQRHLRIGYNRAARIIEMMEREGVIGPADGAKPREVLVRGYDDIP
ncbi:MAG: DNA translocase FtsK [Deltaproteobacteria bacterium]|nr:MAG: DNA translocase FtsK [Deltaproteobacteria bacterium]